MTSAQRISALALLAFVMTGTAIAQSGNDETTGAVGNVDAKNAMQQVEADYKNAKAQCRNAKDKHDCLAQAKKAYDEAKAKVKGKQNGH